MSATPAFIHTSSEPNMLFDRNVGFALASAVEALVLRDESDPMSILRRFVGLKVGVEKSTRWIDHRWHEDLWIFLFLNNNGLAIYELEARVTLTCQSCMGSTHNWSEREVIIVEKEETRPGETTDTYTADADEAFTSEYPGHQHDHWEADY